MDAFHKNFLLLSHLKNFVKIPGVQVFALIQKSCCLSIFDASSAFYVSLLAKFCIPWNLRSFELRQAQRIFNENLQPESP